MGNIERLEKASILNLLFLLIFYLFFVQNSLSEVIEITIDYGAELQYLNLILR